MVTTRPRECCNQASSSGGSASDFASFSGCLPRTVAWLPHGMELTFDTDRADFESLRPTPFGAMPAPTELHVGPYPPLLENGRRLRTLPPGCQALRELDRRWL